MAEVKTIIVNVDTGNSEKELNKVVDSAENLKTALKEGETQADKTAKGVKDVGKSGADAKKGLKAVSNGFKAIGTAIKAAGIGLIIGVFLTLKEVLGQNQKVVDALSSVMGTFSIVINQVFDAISNTFTAVSKATGGFDALGKVLKGVLTLGIEPLKIAFNAIRLSLLNTQLAWEKSFFGDNDPKSLKALNESIKEVSGSIGTSAGKIINAGKDIANNFTEAVGEVGALGSSLIEEVGKVSIKASFEQSKLTQQLANNAKLAEAEQRKLVEQYDRQAEKLRQVRDNDLSSIEDRKKANDELGLVLDKQEKALLKQADAILASANAELKKSNNIENQTALIDAQANRLGVLAQIEGFRSEQDVNKNALIKEGNELVQSGIEADTTRALNQQKFNTSLEEDAIKRLEQQKTDLEAEREIEAERLQLKIDSFALGTQARLDAENELKDRLQEIDQQITINEDEQNNKRVANDKIAADAKSKIQSSVLDVAQQGINVLKQVFEKNKEIQAGLVVAENAAGIAKILTNTAVANAAAVAASPLTGGQPFVALNSVSAGLGIASTVAATAKALSTLGKSGGSGGGSSAPSGGGGSTPPAFNLVGGSGVNQIQDSLQEEQAPIQAFVVGSQVNNQLELDNAQASSASLG
jgi:hypothetical protein